MLGSSCFLVKSVDSYFDKCMYVFVRIMYVFICIMYRYVINTSLFEHLLVTVYHELLYVMACKDSKLYL